MNKLPIALAMTFALAACSAREDSQVATTAEPETEERAEPVETDRGTPATEVVIAAAPGFEVEGNAAVRELEGGRTGVTIEIRGAASEAMLPWHLHEGVCGSGGAIVGDPAAYPPLAAGLDGSASGEATIDVALSPGADYHVNVHKSPSETETIIACGDL